MTCNYCVSRIIIAVHYSTCVLFVVVDSRPARFLYRQNVQPTNHSDGAAHRTTEKSPQTTAAEEVLQFNGIVDAMRD